MTSTAGPVPCASVSPRPYSHSFESRHALLLRRFDAGAGRRPIQDSIEARRDCDQRQQVSRAITHRSICSRSETRSHCDAVRDGGHGLASAEVSWQ
jgi:hypothetical protein